MPSVKKCQADWLANTNEVGGDFCQQLASFHNPASDTSLFDILTLEMYGSSVVRVVGKLMY